MSFGFSVGDIIALGQLTARTYNGWKNACGEYTRLTGELRSLEIIIRRVEAEARTSTSLFARDAGDLHRWGELSKECESVVTELEGVLKKYKSLGTSRRRNWDRIRMGNQDLDELRGKLAARTAALSAFLGVLGMSSLGRMENDMFPELLTKVDEIAARMRAGNGSIMSTYEDDDKEVWRQFRRDLINSGFKSAAIRQHASELKTHISMLHRNGQLDEPVPEMSSSKASTDTLANPQRDSGPGTPPAQAQNADDNRQSSQTTYKSPFVEDYDSEPEDRAGEGMEELNHRIVREDDERARPADHVERAKFDNFKSNKEREHDDGNTSPSSTGAVDGHGDYEQLLVSSDSDESQEWGFSHSSRHPSRPPPPPPPPISRPPPPPPPNRGPSVSRSGSRRYEHFRRTPFRTPSPNSSSENKDVGESKEHADALSEPAHEPNRLREREHAPKPREPPALTWERLPRSMLHPLKQLPELPEGWDWRIDDQNRLFYVDTYARGSEKRCFWHPPKEEVELGDPRGWDRVCTIFGRVFWVHRFSKLVSYEHPTQNPQIHTNADGNLFLREHVDDTVYRHWRHFGPKNGFKLNDDNVACQISRSVWKRGLSEEAVRRRGPLFWGNPQVIERHLKLEPGRIWDLQK